MLKHLPSKSSKYPLQILLRTAADRIWDSYSRPSPGPKLGASGDSDALFPIMERFGTVEEAREVERVFLERRTL